MRALAALALVTLFGCTIPKAPEPAATATPAPVLLAGRFQLRDNFGDGGLYRFDTATGELCFVQNISSRVPIMSPRRWQASYDARKTQAERDRFVKYSTAALAEDCQ